MLQQFFFFLLSTFSYSQNVTIISPYRGENWKTNSEHVITWKSEGISNIKIEYSTDNGNSWNLVSNSFPAFAEIIAGLFLKSVPVKLY